MMKFNFIVHSSWEEGTLFLNKAQKICLFPTSKNANTALRYVLGCNVMSTHQTEKLSGYVRIACVRDPADRLISSYLEILKLRKDSEWDYTIELPFYSIEEPEERFRQFIVDIYDNIYDAHLLPQVYQIYRPLHVDHWILFDNYLKELEEFVLKYKIRMHIDPTLRINKTHQAGIQERLRKVVSKDKDLQAHIRNKMYPEDTKLYNQIKEERKCIV